MQRLLLGLDDVTLQTPSGYAIMGAMAELPEITVTSIKPSFVDEWYGEIVEFEWDPSFDFAAWKQAARDEEEAWFDENPGGCHVGPWPMEKAMIDHLTANVYASPEWRAERKGPRRRSFQPVFEDWDLTPGGGWIGWSEREE